MLLIIEDSDLLRKQIKEMIHKEKPDLKIFEVSTIKESIEFLTSQTPDAVIIDIALPDGNGLELLYKYHSILEDSLKMVLTNYPHKKFRELAENFGVKHFFDKTKDIEKVAPIIINYFLNKEIGISNMENKPIQILVVDDSATLRKMVIAALKEIPDANFSEAQNGLEAIEKLAISKIDAVILDLNMPDIQGMEVLKFIKSHESYKNVKVIILTTRSDEESKIEALKLGADLYMTKPFEPNTLIENFNKIFQGN